MVQSQSSIVNRKWIPATRETVLCKTNPISVKPKVNVSSFLTKDYENESAFRVQENKPNQTQFGFFAAENAEFAELFVV